MMFPGPSIISPIVREVVALPSTGDSVDDPSFPALKRVAIVGAGEYAGTASWQTALGRAREVTDDALDARAASVHPDDPVFIMYTSGTPLSQGSSDIATS